MKSLIDFSLKEKYSKVKKLDDKLAEVESLIKWEAFMPIVAGMYKNDTEKGGRPRADEVVIIKLLLLQEEPLTTEPSIHIKKDEGNSRTYSKVLKINIEVVEADAISSSSWKRVM